MMAIKLKQLAAGRAVAGGLLTLSAYGEAGLTLKTSTSSTSRPFVGSEVLYLNMAGREPGRRNPRARTADFTLKGVTFGGVAGDALRPISFGVLYQRTQARCARPEQQGRRSPRTSSLYGQLGLNLAVRECRPAVPLRRCYAYLSFDGRLRVQALAASSASQSIGIRPRIISLGVGPTSI